MDAVVVIGRNGVASQRLLTIEGNLVGAEASQYRHALPAETAAIEVGGCTVPPELLDHVLAAALRRARSKHNPFEDAPSLLSDRPMS